MSLLELRQDPEVAAYVATAGNTVVRANDLGLSMAASAGMGLVSVGTNGGVEITGCDADGTNAATIKVHAGTLTAPAFAGDGAGVTGIPIANVSGLQAALDAAGASGGGTVSSIADVPGLQDALDAKAATSHTHVIADVDGLQAALDAAGASGGTVSSIADVPGLQAALDAKAATAALQTKVETQEIAAPTGVSGISIQAGTVTVSGSIVPATDVAQDLGTPTQRFRDLYLSSNTLHLGDSKISENTDGGGLEVRRLDTQSGGYKLAPLMAGEILLNGSDSDTTAEETVTLRDKTTGETQTSTLRRIVKLGRDMRPVRAYRDAVTGKVYEDSDFDLVTDTGETTELGVQEKIVADINASNVVSGELALARLPNAANWQDGLYLKYEGGMLVTAAAATGSSDVHSAMAFPGEGTPAVAATVSGGVVVASDLRKTTPGVLNAVRNLVGNEETAAAADQLVYAYTTAPIDLAEVVGTASSNTSDAGANIVQKPISSSSLNLGPFNGGNYGGTEVIVDSVTGTEFKGAWVSAVFDTPTRVNKLTYSWYQGSSRGGYNKPGSLTLMGSTDGETWREITSWTSGGYGTRSANNTETVDIPYTENAYTHVMFMVRGINQPYGGTWWVYMKSLVYERYTERIPPFGGLIRNYNAAGKILGAWLWSKTEGLTTRAVAPTANREIVLIGEGHTDGVDAPIFSRSGVASAIILPGRPADATRPFVVRVGPTGRPIAAGWIGADALGTVVSRVSAVTHGDRLFVKWLWSNPTDTDVTTELPLLDGSGAGSGKTLVAAAGDADVVIAVYSLETGEVLMASKVVANPHPETDSELAVSDGRIWYAFETTASTPVNHLSGTASTLTSSSVASDLTLVQWDATSGELVRAGGVFGAAGTTMYRIAASPHGGVWVAARAPVGTAIQELDGTATGHTVTRDAPVIVGYLPSGTVYSVRQPIAATSCVVTALAVSADTSLFVSGMYRGTPEVFDEDGTSRGTLELSPTDANAGIEASFLLRVAPDGAVATASNPVIGSAATNDITWKPKEGDVVELEGLQISEKVRGSGPTETTIGAFGDKPPLGLAVSPDGRRAATLHDRYHTRILAEAEDGTWAQEIMLFDEAAHTSGGSGIGHSHIVSWLDNRTLVITEDGNGFDLDPATYRIDDPNWVPPVVSIVRNVSADHPVTMATPLKANAASVPGAENDVLSDAPGWVRWTLTPPEGHDTYKAAATTGGRLLAIGRDHATNMLEAQDWSIPADSEDFVMTRSALLPTVQKVLELNPLWNNEIHPAPIVGISAHGDDAAVVVYAMHNSDFGSVVVHLRYTEAGGWGEVAAYTNANNTWIAPFPDASEWSAATTTIPADITALDMSLPLDNGTTLDLTARAYSFIDGWEMWSNTSNSPLFGNVQSLGPALPHCFVWRTRNTFGEPSYFPGITLKPWMNDDGGYASRVTKFDMYSSFDGVTWTRETPSTVDVNDWSERDVHIINPAVMFMLVIHDVTGWATDPAAGNTRFKMEPASTENRLHATSTFDALRGFLVATPADPSSPPMISAENLHSANATEYYETTVKSIVHKDDPGIVLPNKAQWSAITTTIPADVTAMDTSLAMPTGTTLDLTARVYTDSTDWDMWSNIIFAGDDQSSYIFDHNPINSGTDGGPALPHCFVWRYKAGTPIKFPGIVLATVDPASQNTRVSKYDMYVSMDGLSWTRATSDTVEITDSNDHVVQVEPAGTMFMLVVHDLTGWSTDANYASFADSGVTRTRFGMLPAKMMSSTFDVNRDIQHVIGVAAVGNYNWASANSTYSGGVYVGTQSITDADGVVHRGEWFKVPGVNSQVGRVTLSRINNTFSSVVVLGSTDGGATFQHIHTDNAVSFLNHQWWYSLEGNALVTLWDTIAFVFPTSTNTYVGVTQVDIARYDVVRKGVPNPLYNPSVPSYTRLTTWWKRDVLDSTAVDRADPGVAGTYSSGTGDLLAILGANPVGEWNTANVYDATTKEYIGTQSITDTDGTVHMGEWVKISGVNSAVGHVTLSHTAYGVFGTVVILGSSDGGTTFQYITTQTTSFASRNERTWTYSLEGDARFYVWDTIAFVFTKQSTVSIREFANLSNIQIVRLNRVVRGGANPPMYDAWWLGGNAVSVRDGRLALSYGKNPLGRGATPVYDITESSAWKQVAFVGGDAVDVDGDGAPDAPLHQKWGSIALTDRFLTVTSQHDATTGDRNRVCVYSLANGQLVGEFAGDAEDHDLGALTKAAPYGDVLIASTGWHDTTAGKQYLRVLRPGQLEEPFHPKDRGLVAEVVTLRPADVISSSESSIWDSNKPFSATIGSDGSWTTSSAFYSSTYNGTASLTDAGGTEHLGEWVQFTTAEPQRVTDVRFSIKNATNRYASSIVVLASADTGTEKTWSYLGTATGLTYSRSVFSVPAPGGVGVFSSFALVFTVKGGGDGYIQITRLDVDFVRPAAPVWDKVQAKTGRDIALSIPAPQDPPTFPRPAARVQDNTPGSTGEFVVPDNVTKLAIAAVGGGSGGDATNPGAGGALVYGTLTVSPGNVVAWTVGAGGDAGASGTDTVITLNGAVVATAGAGQMTSGIGSGGTATGSAGLTFVAGSATGGSGNWDGTNPDNGGLNTVFPFTATSTVGMGSGGLAGQPGQPGTAWVSWTDPVEVPDTVLVASSSQSSGWSGSTLKDVLVQSGYWATGTTSYLGGYYSGSSSLTDSDGTEHKGDWVQFTTTTPQYATSVTFDVTWASLTSRSASELVALASPDTADPKTWTNLGTITGNPVQTFTVHLPSGIPFSTFALVFRRMYAGDGHLQLSRLDAAFSLLAKNSALAMARTGGYVSRVAGATAEASSTYSSRYITNALRDTGSSLYNNGLTYDGDGAYSNTTSITASDGKVFRGEWVRVTSPDPMTSFELDFERGPKTMSLLRREPSGNHVWLKDVHLAPTAAVGPHDASHVFLANKADMFAYLDVDDLTQAEGEAVSTWGEATANTTGTQPTLAVDASTGERYVNFTGVDEHFVLPQMVMERGTVGFTFIGKVKFASNASWARIFDLGSGQQADNWILARSGTSTNLVFQTYVGTGATLNYSFTTTEFQDGDWITLAVTVTPGGNVQIYDYRGVIRTAQSSNLGSDITWTNLYIGKSNWSAEALFNGGMQKLAFWKTVLSPEEIKTVIRAWGYSPMQLSEGLEVTSSSAYISGNWRVAENIVGRFGPDNADGTLYSGWLTDVKYVYGTGVYNGTKSLTDTAGVEHRGEWVQIDNVTVMSGYRVIGWNGNHRPKNVVALGSNDGGVTWDFLHETQDPQYTFLNSRYLGAPVLFAAYADYKTFALVFKSTFGETRCALQQLDVFGPSVTTLTDSSNKTLSIDLDAPEKDVVMVVRTTWSHTYVGIRRLTPRDIEYAPQVIRLPKSAEEAADVEPFTAARLENTSGDGREYFTLQSRGVSLERSSADSSLTTVLAKTAPLVYDGSSALADRVVYFHKGVPAFASGHPVLPASEWSRAFEPRDGSVVRVARRAEDGTLRYLTVRWVNTTYMLLKETTDVSEAARIRLTAVSNGIGDGRDYFVLTTTDPTATTNVDKQYVITSNYTPDIYYSATAGTTATASINYSYVHPVFGFVSGAGTTFPAQLEGMTHISWYYTNGNTNGPNPHIDTLDPSGSWFSVIEEIPEFTALEEPKTAVLGVDILDPLFSQYAYNGLNVFVDDDTILSSGTQWMSDGYPRGDAMGNIAGTNGAFVKWRLPASGTVKRYRLRAPTTENPAPPRSWMLLASRDNWASYQVVHQVTDHPMTDGDSGLLDVTPTDVFQQFAILITRSWNTADWNNMAISYLQFDVAYSDAAYQTTVPADGDVRSEFKLRAVPNLTDDGQEYFSLVETTGDGPGRMLAFHEDALVARVNARPVSFDGFSDLGSIVTVDAATGSVRLLEGGALGTATRKWRPQEGKQYRVLSDTSAGVFVLAMVDSNNNLSSWEESALPADARDLWKFIPVANTSGDGREYWHIHNVVRDLGLFTAATNTYVLTGTYSVTDTMFHWFWDSRVGFVNRNTGYLLPVGADASFSPVSGNRINSYTAMGSSNALWPDLDAARARGDWFFRIEDSNPYGDITLETDLVADVASDRVYVVGQMTSSAATTNYARDLSNVQTGVSFAVAPGTQQFLAGYNTGGFMTGALDWRRVVNRPAYFPTSMAGVSGLLDKIQELETRLAALGG